MTLPNVSAVVAYLQAEGWKIGKSKAYADAKSPGRLLVQSDGSVLQADADRYARDFLGRADDVAAIQRELLLVELEIKRLQRDRLRLRLDAERRQAANQDRGES